MITRPTCPDLVTLSGHPNSRLLLGKAKADIQENYFTMFKIIQQHRQQSGSRKERTGETESYSATRQLSPQIDVPTSPQRPYMESPDSHTREHSPMVFREGTPSIAQHVSPTRSLIPEIRGEMIKNEQHHKGKKYSPSFLAFCASIFILSSSAYFILRKVLVLPSSRTVERYISREKSRFEFMLRDISRLSELIRYYRERDSTSANESIHAVIAVDALFFDRQIIVKSKGTVEGILTPTDPAKFETLFQSLAEFDEFVIANWNFSINSAFAFYLQPINPKRRNFLIHFYPATSGKANSDTVRVLNELKTKLASCNVSVVAFSADGDSAYSPLINTIHRRVKHSFTECLHEECDIPTLFVSDPLHLLKRGRHRIVSKDLYCSVSSTKLDLRKYKEELQFSKAVLVDDEHSKMKDELAITLFQLKNALHLLRRCAYGESSYIFPFAMFATAISCPNLTATERATLWLYAYGMMDGYRKRQDLKLMMSSGTSESREKLFTNQMVRDFQTTIFSLLRILIVNADSILLSRLSTSPLEHYFSNVRRLSKSIHTYQTFESVTAKLVIINEMEHLIGDQIRSNAGRHSYGAIVEGHVDLSIEAQGKAISQGEDFFNTITSIGGQSDRHPLVEALETLMDKVDPKYAKKNHGMSSGNRFSNTGKDILSRIIRATSMLRHSLNKSR